MKQTIADLGQCIHTYEQLENSIREDMNATTLSYREIAAIVSGSHTQIWSFKKNKCRLQFELLDSLATLFRRPYVLTNVTGRAQKPHTDVESLSRETRAAIRESIKHGISYRKISRITGISHEWIRCFHIKNASIEVRKIIAIADYLGVYYELSNEKTLKRQKT